MTISGTELKQEIIETACHNCPNFTGGACETQCTKVVSICVNTMLSLIDLVHKTDKIAYDMAITMVNTQLTKD